MSENLPFVGFKWLIQDEIDGLDVNKIAKDNSEECILEVDYEYPKELHDLHNDYPLVAEKIEIKESML